MKSPCTLLLIALASAAPLHAAEDRAADALIARGLELRRDRKPQEALEMFQRAHAVAPSPRTFGQMGVVEDTLEHWVDAETHLVAALAVPQDTWVRKNRPVLEQALQSARTHIGQLTFSGPAGATVTVGARLAGSLPGVAPVRIPAGPVLVTASAPGSKQFVTTVNVQAGMETPVAIALEPIDIRPNVATRAPEPTPARQFDTGHRPASWRTWTGAGLLAGGGGLLAWGVVWVAIDGHGAGGMCSIATTDPCNPVYKTKTLGWTLTAVGGAAAVAGGVLLYSSEHSGADVTLDLGPGSVAFAGRF